MAEAVVSFVVEQLGKLAIEETIFLHGVREQIGQMQTELKFLQSLLRDADKRQDENETLRTWISEIREAAYDAEDVIDTFILEVASRRGGSGILNVLKRYSCIFKEWAQRHRVGSEIQSIKANLSNLADKLKKYGITPQSRGEDSSSTYISQRQYAHVEDDIVVGFEEDITKLVAELVNKEKPHRVVSIYGMGGLGKTTLAKKVYHHNDVRKHFDAFAWASISQQFQIRDVCEGILFKLTSPSQNEREEISKLKDDELAEKLYKVQRDKKCLVILDDIWRTEAWDMLRPAFPLGTADSKILLTSRNKEVALHVDPRGFLHDLHCLGEQESWELFEKKAFPKDHHDSVFVEVGRKIVERSGGLPLAIVALGGLLARKETLTEWQQVLENVDSYSIIGKGHGSKVEKVLALSYQDLPYHLKPCFLYLSHFPEDFKIPARKLTQMWVAEGFVSMSQDENLEAIAEGYLYELIDRCMVQVGTRTTSGRIKTFRLHDLMRDLSISIAKQENFFNFIDLGDDNEQTKSSTSMVSSDRVHRLAISMNKRDSKRSILSSKYENNFHLRSLFLLEGNRIPVTEQQLKSIFNKFKLLRVFSLEGIAGASRIALTNLIVHRLILDSKERLKSPNVGCLQILNLQCFDFHSKLVIPNVIWKMERLIHVYLPSFGNWTSTGKLRLGNLRNLQTLVNFHADKCYVKDLIKLTNLRKLSLCSFDPTRKKTFVEMLEPLSRVTLNKLWSLSLKIWYTRGAEKIDVGRIVSGFPHLYKLYVLGELEKLPSYDQFPSNITKLVLEYSRLDEDPMPTLEKLPNLRILRLQSWAFIGPKIVCSKEGFPQLKSLLLNLLENLKEWWVEEGAMPSLHRLEISYCDRLENLPDGLRFITTLRELEIRYMPEEFKERLNEGGEDFDKIKHMPSVLIK